MPRPPVRLGQKRPRRPTAWVDLLDPAVRSLRALGPDEAAAAMAAELRGVAHLTSAEVAALPSADLSGLPGGELWDVWGVAVAVAASKGRPVRETAGPPGDLPTARRALAALGAHLARCHASGSRDALESAAVGAYGCALGVAALDAGLALDGPLPQPAPEGA